MSRLARRLENAVGLLARGFVSHPANAGLRQRLQSQIDPQGFYRQLNYLVYRFVFLLIAEDRGLLKPHLRDVLGGHVRPGSGSRLWNRVGAMFNALAADGDQPLGIPVLGGSFWSPASTPDLLSERQQAEKWGRSPVCIDDTHLLNAFKEIALDSPGEPSPRFGSHEELGSAYEHLLTLKPRIVLDATREHERFLLGTAANHARKTSGSYYTPETIVQFMLGSALDPVFNERTKGLSARDAERALLSLKVCDPACGVGYFLIAAARRLALGLAQIRTGRQHPRPESVQTALRDVIRQCIYGVDLDPMAVDLCRINLWFEANEPGLPLADLDQRIRCGNALLGATPELIAEGIPDAAFTVLRSDNPKAIAYYRARNRRERTSQRSTTTAAPKDAADSVHHDRAVADAWCSAFVWRKHATDAAGPLSAGEEWEAITNRVFCDVQTAPNSVAPWIRDEVARLAHRHRFFHWHVEFPEIFTSEHSGFDVLLGNPPFLNQLQSATVTARGVEAIIRARFKGAIRGYTDLSATFLILATSLTAPGGRVALVQPQSLLAIKDAAPVRIAVLQRASLESLWVSNEHVFDDAGVYTCIPTLRVGGPRKSALRRFASSAFTELASVEIDNDRLANEETWAHLTAAASGIPEVRVPAERTLADIADATADFRDQYYGLQGFLIEDAALTPEQRADWDRFPALLTSGLVDLCEIRWGKLPTRILKQKWAAPRIDRRHMEVKGSLGAWLTSRLVPKVLVATQTRIIEAFTDAAGRFIPSVPLITLTPKRPDDLWRLASAIASPVCSAIAMQRYAGAAMNADSIKLSAKQILRMPLPSRHDLWDRAAAQLQSASETTASRSEALRLFATVSCESYAIPPKDAELLASWWLNRLERAPKMKKSGASATRLKPDRPSGPHPARTGALKRASNATVPGAGQDDTPSGG